MATPSVTTRELCRALGIPDVQAPGAMARLKELGLQPIPDQGEQVLYRLHIAVRLWELDHDPEFQRRAADALTRPIHALREPQGRPSKSYCTFAAYMAGKLIKGKLLNERELRDLEIELCKSYRLTEIGSAKPPIYPHQELKRALAQYIATT